MMQLTTQQLQALKALAQADPVAAVLKKAT